MQIHASKAKHIMKNETNIKRARYYYATLWSYMYVSGIRVSSFLTIMYLWNGKKNTHTRITEKNKQYNNVVVLNVQSLFEKEETSKKIVSTAVERYQFPNKKVVLK